MRAGRSASRQGADCARGRPQGHHFRGHGCVWKKRRVSANTVASNEVVLNYESKMQSSIEALLDWLFAEKAISPAVAACAPFLPTVPSPHGRLRRQSSQSTAVRGDPPAGPRPCRASVNLDLRKERCVNAGITFTILSGSMLVDQISSASSRPRLAVLSS